MKNKLITILSICAAFIISLCSVNLKTIDAAEEEPAAAASGETYTNNLFSQFSYGRYNKYGYTFFNHASEDESGLIYSNLFEISDNNNDMLISMRFKLSDTSYNPNTFNSSNDIYLYNNHFIELESFYLDYVTNEKNITSINFDSSGEYAIVNILTANPRLYSFSGSCDYSEYMTISPKLSYTTQDNRKVVLNAKNVVNMYVSFIDGSNINNVSELEKVSVDYSLYNSGISFKYNNTTINSNYLEFDIQNNYEVVEFLNNLKAFSNDGKLCVVEYGYILETEFEYYQGNIFPYFVKATDENGNVEFLYCVATEKDLTAPVISGANEYTVPNGSTLSLDSIKKTLIVTDNIDKTDDIRITLKYDFFTENRSNPGTWYVCFNATDKAGNVSEDFIIKINVADKEAPVFYDINNVAKTNAIVYKSTDSVLVLSDIVNDLKAIDDVDGEREITVHRDNYTGNGEIVGSYLVVLKAKDNSGNVAYYNVNIIVSEKMTTKTIFIDNKVILVEKNIKLNRQDFHGIIQMLGRYNPNTTSYTTINEEIYLASWNETGDYIVEYSIVSTAGYEEDGIFVVRVIESRTGNSFIDEKEEEKSWILSALEWLWNLILSFFEWIGSLFS